MYGLVPAEPEPDPASQAPFGGSRG